MLRFIVEGGKSYVYDDTSSEDGWIFTYDPTTSEFLVWDNVERQIDGAPPERVRTMEEVYALTASYT